MIKLPEIKVRRQTGIYEAVCFKGTSESAMQILDWALERGAPALGHLRQGIGSEPDSIFIPAFPTGTVVRLDRGSYLLFWARGRFAAVTEEEFDRLYEVVECLPQ